MARVAVDKALAGLRGARMPEREKVEPAEQEVERVLITLAAVAVAALAWEAQAW